ncbi:PREDICTED: uncharacterized protein LOC104598310 [Nelumbo nucifera]|uniref:Uncharacterized protein LOC104598310 n=2 Tax=Nelumbo nucifera TaxID=4432 RepID=A0A1U8AAG2_NELNU|nr:PREDICTED: uncharacterized protein LOC104598310 [Nelumbo nucifera]DAD43515.1 TPA_asm: hypothetical protein HUJ06_001745 [Nelumbo nucifera]
MIGMLTLEVEMKGSEMEQKDYSDSEGGTKSPEVRAFCDLVEREAHRIQLLNGRIGGDHPEKPSTNNFIVWQPSFIMEDFGLKEGLSGFSSSGGGNKGGGCDEGKEKKRLKRTLKRPRDLLVDMAPLHVSKERLLSSKKGTNSSSVVICDLNKEADEPTEGADLWRLWCGH